MNNKIWIILLGIAAINCASEPVMVKGSNAREMARNNGYDPVGPASSDIYTRNDEFEKTITYTHAMFTGKESSEYRPMEIYIYQTGKRREIVAAFIHTDSDWIFMDSATLINADGKRKAFRFGPNVTRKSGGRGVLETDSIKLSKSDINDLKKILAPKKYPQLRLSGQDSRDLFVHEDDAAAMLKVIDFYEKM